MLGQQNIRIGVLLLLLVGMQLSLWGQLTTEADFKRQVYDRDFTFGITLNTQGYGINARYGFLSSGYTKHAAELDVVNIRHPKENKTYPDFLSNSAGFVFGRLNAMYAVRTGYYRENILHDKTDQGTVSVSFFYGGGVSWGFLKPIFVQVQTQESNNFVVEERYDPTAPDRFIRGQAGFFRGIDETLVRPGLYVKAGFYFDNHERDERVRGAELGIVIDAYPSEMTIMHDATNNNVFFQLYLAINFGKKWTL
jgi:hypothetical protein